MADIKLHPDGYPLIRFTEDQISEPGWYGFTWIEEGGITAYRFSDDEAKDWPPLFTKEEGK